MSASCEFSELPISGVERKIHVEFIALCEEALKRPGRLEVLGSLDAITVPQLPYLSVDSKLVVRLRIPPQESGSHCYALHIVDPRGRDVIDPLQASFCVDPHRANCTSTFNLILALPALPLAHSGEHRLEFHLDGQIEVRLAFQVSVRESAVVSAHNVPATPRGNSKNRRGVPKSPSRFQAASRPVRGSSIASHHVQRH